MKNHLLLNADEFVYYNESKTTAEMIFNKEILKTVLSNNQEKETEELPLPTITHNKAIESYDKVVLYLKQQEDKYDIKKEDLRFVKKLRKETLKNHFISTRQDNLDNFINIIE